MQLLEVRLQNFLSHEDSKLRLADRGLVLIEGENRDAGGSNGAGKSAIFDGIRWCLFGETGRGLRADEVCRRGHRNTCVAVDLAVGSVRATVSRYRNHATCGNQLRLVIDGKSADQATERETQGKIVELLQLDASTFTSVALYPQGVKGFASLTDSEQKAVLEKLLGFERFNKAQEKAKGLVGELATSKNALLQKLNGLSASISQQQARIASLEAKEQLFEAEKTSAVTQLQQTLLGLKATVFAVDTGLDEKIKELESQLVLDPEAINKQAFALDSEAQALRLTLSQAEQKKQYAELNIKQLKLKLFDPEKRAAGKKNCPTCNQALPAAGYEAYLQSLREELAKIQLEISQAEQQAQLGVPGIEGYGDRISSLLYEKQGLLAKLSVHYAKQNEIQQLQAMKRSQEEAARGIKAKIEATEMLLQQALARTSPFKELIEKELSLMQGFEKEMMLKRAELDGLESDIRYFDFWVTGFGNQGVKSYLLDTITPILNERGNAYLKTLTRGQAKLTFNTQKVLKSGEKRDKFNVDVDYFTGGDQYKGISGGECRRVDIAVLFALGDLAASRALAPVELRLLDEIFENIDSAGQPSVIEVLRQEVLPRAKTILVMTHQDDFKDEFDTIVRVVKQGGVSRIVDSN